MTGEHIYLLESPPISKKDFERFPGWAERNLPKLAAIGMEALRNAMGLQSFGELTEIDNWVALPDPQEIERSRPHKNKVYFDESSLIKAMPKPGEWPKIMEPVLKDPETGEFLPTPTRMAYHLPPSMRSLFTLLASGELHDQLKAQGRPVWILEAIQELAQWTNEYPLPLDESTYMVVDTYKVHESTSHVVDWFLEGLKNVLDDKGIKEYLQGIRIALAEAACGNDINWSEVLRVDFNKFPPPSDESSG